MDDETTEMVVDRLAFGIAVLPLSALAEETETPLPYGVRFGMSVPEVEACVGESAHVESWSDDDGSGSVLLEDAPLGIGGIHGRFIPRNVTSNISPRETRLEVVGASIAFEGNCIVAFRSALADLTQQYGQPDRDPFDELGQESYQKNGSLNACWTTPDTIIYLMLNQMYSPSGSLDLSFTNRLCYDLSDLDIGAE